MKSEKIRQNSIKKRILVILIIMISLIIMNYIATKIIFASVFARYDYVATNIDMPYTAEDAEKYPRENVTFSSGENLLSGRFYRIPSAKGTILIAHGMQSMGDRYLDVTEYFLDQGWNVMTFDMTGTGESEGSDMVGLPQMKLDVLAALDWIKTSSGCESLPIVLYGHSMGGYAVVTVLSETTDVSAVICLSAFNNANEIMLSKARQYVGFLATVGYPSMCLENRSLFGDDAGEDAWKILNETNVPVLVVQGSGDTMVTEDLSLYNHRLSITNPLVSYLYVEEPFRNRHSTLWLTTECAEYTLEIHEKHDTLVSKYGRALPEDIYADFIKDVDFSRLNCLDEKFMNTLENFLDSSVK